MKIFFFYPKQEMI